MWDIVSQVKGRRGTHSDDPDGELRDSGVPSAEIKGSDSDKSEQTAGPVPDNAAPPSAGSLRDAVPKSRSPGAGAAAPADTAQSDAVLFMYVKALYSKCILCAPRLKVFVLHRINKEKRKG